MSRSTVDRQVEAWQTGTAGRFLGSDFLLAFVAALGTLKVGPALKPSRRQKRPCLHSSHSPFQKRSAAMTRLLPAALYLVFSPIAFADDLGQRRLYENLKFYAQTSSSTGAAVDADSAPGYRVYEDQTGSALVTGSMAQLDSGNTDGFYSAAIDLTPANGFERGKSYVVRFSAPVSSVTKADFHTFTLHPNEILVQHDGNNSTSGATLESRIESATAGALILIGPGVFDIGTTPQIVIPADVSVRGAGIGATQITKSGSGVCLVPGDRSVVEHLTIDASAAGQGYGSDGTQQFDDALLRHVQVKGDADAVYVSGTGASTLTMEWVWLESDFDGMIVGDAGHKVSMRDVFIRAAHPSLPNPGLTVSSSAEVRGTRVNIDITSGPAPIGVSANNTALVELFDSSIWVDPAATLPTSINVNDSTAKVRLINCEFDRSLTRGHRQQIRDVSSLLRASVVLSTTIDALTSQTVFTLTTGPSVDDALNGRFVVITDNADDTRRAVGVVSDYVGSTRQVTLTANPGVFTMGDDDLVDVLVDVP
jgi:hypothetical protein